MKYGKILLFAGVLACLCGGVAEAQTTAHTAKKVQSAAVHPSPESWLQDKGRELLSALSEKETKKRYLRLRHVGKQVFKIDELARLAMGKNWREMAEYEQQGLKDVFLDYFVVTYGSTAINMDSVKIDVVEKRPSGKDILLKTEVKVDFGKTGTAPSHVGDDALPAVSKDKSGIETLFALRQTDDGYYIRDAKIEGQSLLLFLRSKMENELKSAEGDFDKLINKLRSRVNSRYRAAEDLAAAHERKAREQ